MRDYAIDHSGQAGARSRGAWKSLLPPFLRMLIGGALILATSQVVLSTRSTKYLVALIIVGAGASCLLALRGKHTFLLFLVGLSLPLYMEFLLLDDRTSTLSITGTLLTVFLLAAASLFTGSIDWRRLQFVPSITVPAILFLLAGLLSLVNTTDRTATFLAIAQEGEMLVLFLVLTNAIREEAHLSAFLGGLYSSLMIEGGIYVVQNVLGISFDLVGNSVNYGATDVEAGYIHSQRGTLGAGPIITGMYFGVMTLTLIGAYLSRKTLKTGVNSVLGIVTGGTCMILAAKRSPWGGFALGIVVMLLLVWRFSPERLRRFGRILALVAAPCMVLLPLILLRASANNEGDYQERVNLTRIAWRMIDAHPWTGVGLGTYNYVKRDYLPEGWVGWVFTVHNRYLLILAESGIVGAACMVLMYIMVLRLGFKGIRAVNAAYRPYQIGLFAALVAIHWQMLWEIYVGRQQEYIYWMIASVIVVLPRVLWSEEGSMQSAGAIDSRTGRPHTLGPVRRANP